jgi:hypothetical protein
MRILMAVMAMSKYGRYLSQSFALRQIHFKRFAFWSLFLVLGPQSLCEFYYTGCNSIGNFGSLLLDIIAVDSQSLLND